MSALFRRVDEIIPRTRNSTIIDKITSIVNDHGYGVQSPEELPTVVHGLAYELRDLHGLLKAFEAEENMPIGRAPLKERLASMIWRYRRSHAVLVAVELAIQSGVRVLRQDGMVPQMALIDDFLSNILEVFVTKESRPVPTEPLLLHILDVHHKNEELKFYKRLLEQISQRINEGRHDFENLPGIVARLAVKALPSDDHGRLSTGQNFEAPDEDTGFMNAPGSRQLQAHIQYPEQWLEIVQTSTDGQCQQTEIEQQDWASANAQYEKEVSELREDLEESKKSHEQEVERLKAGNTDNIITINAEHGKTIAELREEHHKELEKRISQTGELHKEIVRKLKGDHSAKERDREKSMAQNDSLHQEAIKDLEDAHDITVKGLQALHETKVAGLKKELAGEAKTAREMLQQQKQRFEEYRKQENFQIEADHKRKISNIEHQYAATLAASTKTHAQKQAELQSEFDVERGTLTKSIEQLQKNSQEAKDSIERMQQSFKAQVLKQTKIWEKKMQVQQKASEETTSAQDRLHKEESRRLCEVHRTELASRMEQCANRIADADVRHAERKNELLILQDRLQKRDNHVALTDAEILEGRIDDSGDLEVHGMATLLAEVKRVAAWTWREERESWPQEVMFALAGDKQKRLRKLILGDIIWTVLFHAVFCSPFRLLGDVGKKLEYDWSQNFGEGTSSTATGEYIWPRATLDSEKWRYDTCQDALRSLTKPTTEFSDDGRLKKSFFNNRKVVRKQLMESIRSLVELDKEQEAELDVFILNAVRTWLYFGTQRYRLQLFLTGSTDLDQEKKMELVQRGDMMFTIAPRLQRIGNSRGTELNEICTVSGCVGSQEPALL